QSARVSSVQMRIVDLLRAAVIGDTLTFQEP
ncbi:MAG: hypothetical protein ACI9U2_004302, partial [Bradymonadia bacterium]